MTFYEAAVAVLREAGRALHYKKITAAAVERELLSHVGKTPEDTMNARLSQEAAKPSDAAVIEEVRPGVFGLRAGVDLDDAGETITLRAPSLDDVPEPDPVTDDAELEDDGPVAAPSVVRVNDEDDRKRRGRRSRRGGRRRDNEDSNDSDSDNDSDDDSDDEKAETPASDSDSDSEGSRGRRGGRRRPGRRRDRNDEDNGSADNAPKEQGRDDAPAIPLSDDLPDIAAAAVTILKSAKAGSPSSASKVAKDLARRNVGALGELGTAGLRSALLEANSRRAREGRPPVFDETKPNFWTLATASDSSLARSYDALEKWQGSHRSALAETVAGKVAALDDEGLGTLVTLLLDRMGYTDIERHNVSPTTVSARSPLALTRTRVAIRVYNHKQRVGKDEVAALRGSLHQFNAAAGIVFSFGRVLNNASEETDVPNVAPITVIDAAETVQHLMRAGVGINRFSVDVSCLDDALFRELRKS